MLPSIMSATSSALRLSRMAALSVASSSSSSGGAFMGMCSHTPQEEPGRPGARDGSIDFGFRDVPRADKEELVGQVFHSVADSYDVMNDLMSGGMHRMWKDRLVETLRPFPGQAHLDVAGGTGDVAFRILRAIRRAEIEAQAKSQAVPAQGRQPQQHARGAATGALPHAHAGADGGHVAGVNQPVHTPESTPGSPEAGTTVGSVVVCDINASMLEQGRRKAAAAADLAGDAGLSFVEGNAETLPQFRDASFDSYTVAFGIRNVTDRGAALREAHRVLRRGGRFLCLEFSTVAQPGLRELYDAYSFNVIPAIGQLVANDSASYQYLVESIRKFPDQEAFAAMIEAAGFEAVTHESLMGGIVAIHSGFKL